MIKYFSKIFQQNKCYVGTLVTVNRWIIYLYVTIKRYIIE